MYSVWAALQGQSRGSQVGWTCRERAPQLLTSEGVVQGALGCLLACLSLRVLVFENGDRAHRLGRGMWELSQRAVLLTRNRWVLRKSQ